MRKIQKTTSPQNSFNKLGDGKHVHFIGIGGIGTSALARWLFSKKWLVSGSDIAKSKITEELKKEGITVKIGHKKTNLPAKTSLVIYNQAIPFSNSELKEARRRNIKTLSYPEALGELTKNYKTIAIAGAHGKSTTTAFVSLILVEAGFDPTVIIGSRLKQFNPASGGKNFRLGKSEYLIIEACEWKNAFLNYSPTAAIITNIDREHLDFFKNISNVKKSFLNFIKNVKRGGNLILNLNDKNLLSLKVRINTIAKINKLNVFWYHDNPPSSVSNQIRRILKVPGKHNAQNALGAYALAQKLGIKEKLILKALGEYTGIWRRLEYRDVLKIKNCKLKIPVYDDYAHHPTEIKATLSALREKYPKNRIICVFQPHQAERLKLLFKDFISAFDEADYLILLPVYEVAGRDKKNTSFTSKKLAEVIRKKKLSPNIAYLGNPKSLKKTINYLIANYQLPELPITVVMMGAGDIVKYTDLLIK